LPLLAKRTYDRYYDRTVNMIRGFFDEMLVAERQFTNEAAEMSPGFSMATAIDNKAYRQLRFAKLKLADAEVTSDAQISSLDTVRVSICMILKVFVDQLTPCEIMYLMQRPAHKSAATLSFQMETEILRQFDAEQRQEAEEEAYRENSTPVLRACGVPL